MNGDILQHIDVENKDFFLEGKHLVEALFVDVFPPFLSTGGVHVGRFFFLSPFNLIMVVD